MTDSTRHSVLERIEHFADLHEGWDSYSALPVKHGTISAAKSLLVLAACQLRAQGHLMTRPVAAPVSRGSVQLAWEGDERYLEIEVYSERRLAYMLTVGEVSISGAATRNKALELVVWFHAGGEQ